VSFGWVDSSRCGGFVLSEFPREALFLDRLRPPNILSNQRKTNHTMMMVPNVLINPASISLAQIEVPFAVYLSEKGVSQVGNEPDTLSR